MGGREIELTAQDSNEKLSEVNKPSYINIDPKLDNLDNNSINSNSHSNRSSRSPRVVNASGVYYYATVTGSLMRHTVSCRRKQDKILFILPQHLPAETVNINVYEIVFKKGNEDSPEKPSVTKLNTNEINLNYVDDHLKKLASEIVDSIGEIHVCAEILQNSLSKYRDELVSVDAVINMQKKLVYFLEKQINKVRKFGYKYYINSNLEQYENSKKTFLHFLQTSGLNLLHEVFDRVFTLKNKSCLNLRVHKNADSLIFLYDLKMQKTVSPNPNSSNYSLSSILFGYQNNTVSSDNNHHHSNQQQASSDANSNNRLSCNGSALLNGKLRNIDNHNFIRQYCNKVYISITSSVNNKVFDLNNEIALLLNVQNDIQNPTDSKEQQQQGLKDLVRARMEVDNEITITNDAGQDKMLCCLTPNPHQVNSNNGKITPSNQSEFDSVTLSEKNLSSSSLLKRASSTTAVSAKNTNSAVFLSCEQQNYLAVHSNSNCEHKDSRINSVISGISVFGGADPMFNSKSSSVPARGRSKTLASNPNSTGSLNIKSLKTSTPLNSNNSTNLAHNNSIRHNKSGSVTNNDSASGNEELLQLRDFLDKEISVLKEDTSFQQLAGGNEKDLMQNLNNNKYGTKVKKSMVKNIFSKKEKRSDTTKSANDSTTSSTAASTTKEKSSKGLYKKYPSLNYITSTMMRRNTMDTRTVSRCAMQVASENMLPGVNIGGGSATVKEKTSTASAATIMMPKSDDRLNTTEITIDDDFGMLDRQNTIDDSADDFMAQSDTWSTLANQKTLKKMTQREIKRQDIIYELIYTENQYVRTLKTMIQVLYNGMIRFLKMETVIVDNLLPDIKSLQFLNGRFLAELKSKQDPSNDYMVTNLSEVFLNQFTGPIGESMGNVYGNVCSRKNHSVGLYKELLKNSKTFATFVQLCSNKVELRRLTIPECITFITQRPTKYPLLIEAMLKCTREDDPEYDKLKQSLECAKKFLNRVNQIVNENENSLELNRIREKLDSKIEVLVQNITLHSYDIIPTNAKLLFTKKATLRTKAKLYEVLVVALHTHLVIFVEKDSKYVLAPTEKPPIIQMNELMVREVATDKNAFFVVDKKSATMHEIVCDLPMFKQELISSLNKHIKTI